MPFLRDYSDIRDAFSYVLLGAPNFPNKNVTLDSAFSDIYEGIENLIGRTRNAEALSLLRKCIEVTKEAHQFYRENELREGALRIQDAQELFVKAGKLRKGKASAERVEDDYQEDQNQQRPSTTTH